MLQECLRVLGWVIWTMRALVLPKHALALENLALRQQLAVLQRTCHRPRLDAADRLFWVVLRRVWDGWQNALALVEPDTVVRWHRALFRGYWRWKSRRRGRPRTNAEMRALIRTMARQNHWGAPRIHGELRKLGFDVSERTVSRYLRRLAPRRHRGNATWRTFLHNHRTTLAAMDFFTVPTATFRVLYVLVVLHHGRRRVLHFNVTEHPTSAWVCQQLREAFPGDAQAPDTAKYLLFDRDSTFSAQVVATVKSFGMKPLRTAYRSPWQNGAAERLVGTIRRDLLDHVIVLSENHLRRLLGELFSYYHDDRTHLALEKDCPIQRAVEYRPSPGATVVALPRIGGLHHRYRWREAA